MTSKNVIQLRDNELYNVTHNNSRGIFNSSYGQYVICQRNRAHHNITSEYSSCPSVEIITSRTEPYLQ